MNLPNILTLSRFFLTFVFVFFIFQKGLTATMLAAVFFAVASLTDFYDGYLAKKHNLTSDFGKIMDPIADKFLILAAFFVFVKMGLLNGTMFILIFWREVLVTLLRLYAMGQGKVIAAEKAGKCKTVAQLFVIALVLLYLILNQLNLGADWSQSAGLFLSIINIFMGLAVALTIFSGLSYFWQNRGLMRL